MVERSFVLRQRSDGLFYLAIVALAWVAIYMGFSPDVAARFSGRADYTAPWVLVVHVFSFFGWMTVLTLQILFVRVRRTDLHRVLGWSIVVLVPVMVASGLGAEYVSQHFYTPRDPDNARFYIIPLSSMVLFGVTASAAFVLRRDTLSHKRLILVATILLLSAAYGRWFGEPIETALGPGFWGTLASHYAALDLMLVAMVAYDQMTRGSVHRSLAIAVPLVLVAHGLVSWISLTDWWPIAARIILGM